MHHFSNRDNKGQASVEFAIVLGLLIVVVVGVAAIGHKLDAGVFVDHAIAASSHNLTNSIGGLVDAFLY